MAQPQRWKPYYMKKEKFPDGRDKILIAWYESERMKKTLSLLKPEEMIDIMIPIRNLLRNGITVPEIARLLQSKLKDLKEP